MRQQALWIFRLCMDFGWGSSPVEVIRDKWSFVKPGRESSLMAICIAILVAACAILFQAMSSVPLHGQNVVSSGALIGRVKDQSGAVVPGTSVVVRNLATGVQQSLVTNSVGFYRMPVLTPGTYSVRAHLKGFRDIQAQVEVLVGSTTAQDFKLQVGVANLDTVMVTGQGP